ncbi:MAG: metallophosphoesterase family protein [Campylobacterota bacterium]|nr:metallophosphoesterase family protein [Campylobacterota bacterium]
MKIAILSDSHRKTDLTDDAIQMLKSKGASYMIHAGDLETKENLELLKNSELIYTSVFGNNDHNLIQYQHQYNINKEPYYFKIKELKFKLMHLPFYMSADSDIVVFGHTHYFETKYEHNTLFINPGEICAREKNLTECVLLTINEKRYIIEYNFKKPNEKTWETKTIEYERK